MVLQSQERDQKEQIEEMKEEIQQLKMDNAILKQEKIETFFEIEKATRDFSDQ